jgi:hypothetical protein
LQLAILTAAHRNATTGSAPAPGVKGSDEEILEWCFERGRRPSEEEIWNAFLLKRGWRDESRAELEAVKKEENLGGRDDIQTWVDLHDAGEGRIRGSAP